MVLPARSIYGVRVFLEINVKIGSSRGNVVLNALSTFYNMGRPKLHEHNFKFSDCVKYQINLANEGKPLSRFETGGIFSKLEKCKRTPGSPYRFDCSFSFLSRHKTILYECDFKLICHKKNFNRFDLENILYKRMNKYDGELMDDYVKEDAYIIMTHPTKCPEPNSLTSLQGIFYYPV